MRRNFLVFSAILAALAVPLGAAPVAYALSCLAPRTTATLELESITVDGVAAPLPDPAPSTVELWRYAYDYDELYWLDDVGSHYLGLEGATE